MMSTSADLRTNEGEMVMPMVPMHDVLRGSGSEGTGTLPVPDLVAHGLARAADRYGMRCARQNSTKKRTGPRVSTRCGTSGTMTAVAGASTRKLR